MFLLVHIGQCEILVFWYHAPCQAITCKPVIMVNQGLHNYDNKYNLWLMYSCSLCGRQMKGTQVPSVAAQQFGKLMMISSINHLKNSITTALTVVLPTPYGLVDLQESQVAS